MSIRFDKFNAEAPGGSWIGLIGHGDSGVAEVLAGIGFVCPNLSALELPARLAWLDEAEKVRREGGVVLAYASEPEMLRNLADEVWWLEGGALREKGDPKEVIARYTQSVYAAGAELNPSLRRGDGRAEIVAIEVLNEQGELASFVQSGKTMGVRVTVKYNAAVEKPVVGIMLRTRIGFEVYGTNTELEGVAVGPVAAGETRVVTYRFECQLCPQIYTVTAASHDPDGVWHEWMEDAISFTVGDTRYTAGVANLRAQVTVG